MESGHAADGNVGQPGQDVGRHYVKFVAAVHEQQVHRCLELQPVQVAVGLDELDALQRVLIHARVAAQVDVYRYVPRLWCASVQAVQRRATRHADVDDDGLVPETGADLRRQVVQQLALGGQYLHAGHGHPIDFAHIGLLVHLPGGSWVPI